MADLVKGRQVFAMAHGTAAMATVQCTTIAVFNAPPGTAFNVIPGRSARP
jgi:hypothetical protein